MAGEFDLVGRAVGVGEGEGEGALGLGGGAFAGDAVLFRLGAGGLVRGGGAVHVAVGPPDVAVDAVVAPGPAEVGDDRVGGGEVAGKAGEVRQAAAGGGARRPPVSATYCMPRRDSAERPRSRWALAR
ncbi:hypothetical protein [Streptomyces sp. NPDC058855]|uniref:hypothetical protein n=1 Tax=Streptomyces sp. NPDC058855 TaxID=3346651 RepID=UPI003686318E